ncbi:TrkH family potassium uptake protein [Dongia deserti]|uniref:TrkH family potassium uptake protein n=1 Tax=Dongia deserti TaxID=2268030 RepID=UPI000E65A855|nr:TrkH family potassium uptake protein [Dongia deserti]
MSWPDHRSVFYTLGMFLSGIAALMLLPALADYAADHRNWTGFIAGAAVSGGAGGAMILAFRTNQKPVIGRREGFLLTSLTWVVMCAFAALPLALSDAGLGYTDAFFETMSGLTTTGSTVMVGLDTQSRGILLWRSILQWLGGIGIIVLAVMMLPYLGVGGMQLFRTEFSEKVDKIRARAVDVTWEIFSIYAVLTVICAVLLTVAGMPLFDAVCHAMTSVATAGFSTKDASIGYYGPLVQWIIIVFMFIGALAFMLMARLVWHGDWRSLLRDEQVRWYAFTMVCVIILVTLWQFGVNGRDLESAFRSSAFNVVSILTTTGFSSEDYSAWGTFPLTLFMILLFVGGCTGSTAGGMKIFRFCILGSFAKWQIRSLVHRNRVLLPTYNGVAVTEDVIRSVIGFIVLYIFTFVILGLAIAAFQIDILTAYSAAAQALGNVGPGLGPIIGPSGNYASLPDGVKWLLAFGMLIGRLELLTVMVLFTPTFWRG